MFKSQKNSVSLCFFISFSTLCLISINCASTSNRVASKCPGHCKSKPVTSLGPEMPNNECVEIRDNVNIVYFDPKDSTVGMENNAFLDRLADCLSKNPDWHAQINGHTDQKGSAEENLQLGKDRSQAVLNHLARLGVARDRMKSASFGESQLKDSNETEEAMARNRRVEVTVMKKER